MARPEDDRLLWDWEVVATQTQKTPHGPRTLEARVAVYAPQGAVYVRALEDALALEEPPRFELWFLQSERVV